jgi:transketolase
MTTLDLPELQGLSLRVREHIVRMSGRGGCFIGASLSCADLIVYLYRHFLRIDRDRLDHPDRDYLFLSKGHDVPALYGMFAEMGWISKDRLQNHLKVTDHLYWHPNRNVPGVEFHSGSLGHLLSVALGVALDCKMTGSPNRVVVLLGDGELNEGSIWEGCLVAHAYRLDNLILVVDRNQFQANVRTEDLIPLEPLEYKFMSFGCAAECVDGHDFDDLHDIFTTLPFKKDHPSVVIAETVRGKGLPSIEKRADRWFCNFSDVEVDALLHELHTHEYARLTAATIVAR